MRIKEGFVLREVCGETVVVAEGLKMVNYSKIIRLNSSASYIWKAVQGKEFDEETIADLLCEAYTVEREQALADAAKLCEVFRNNDIVE